MIYFPLFQARALKQCTKEESESSDNSEASSDKIVTRREPSRKRQKKDNDNIPVVSINNMVLHST